MEMAGQITLKITMKQIRDIPRKTLRKLFNLKEFDQPERKMILKILCSDMFPNFADRLQLVISRITFGNSVVVG